MPELDCRHSAHRLDHCCDSGESFELGIVVNPGAGYACPPVRGYCQLFGEHKTEAPSRARAKQHHVIIIHQTIMGAVHRHGRHRDPIAQRHPFERVGTEQIRHGFISTEKECDGQSAERVDFRACSCSSSEQVYYPTAFGPP